MKTKLPSFDGKFYPKDTIELESKLKKLFKETPHKYTSTTRAVIVPHSGYTYSGHVCANTYQYINKKLDNIFIFAPAHYIDFKGIALSSSDSFSTPLGKIFINKEINSVIEKIFNLKIFDAAFEKEHALEVQLPFIQTLLPNAKIIPIVYNNCLPGKLQEIIQTFWLNKEYGTSGFVISSDLSHFYPRNEAEKIDEYTARMIESKNTKNFHPAQACGSKGIIALTDFAKEHKFSLIRVQLTNSAERTKDDASVIGYGGWFLEEE